ncbi:hypothetical protein MSG28_015807 [Choristoneura fumiferana]|uniref:Uncharacterized protein n=1 Tax=Choristoneura fumiferana TaxID=7141 RepID=A0ACC0KC16_CHOFU|nr:hypothetical protein MSG28_015807 [Choristoneura fumiferana]
MYKVVVFAILLTGCRSANVNKHMKMLTELEDTVEPKAFPPRVPRPFLELARAPAPLTAHPQGTTVTLTCEAFAAPAPSIRWFKNNQPVYEYTQESNDIFDVSPTSLARVESTLLVSRTLGQDEYTCVATAGAKTARGAPSSTAQVKSSTSLIDRVRLVPLAPQILVTYKVYMDIIGSNVVLPCHVKGHPRPQVTWKNSRRLTVKKDPRMKVLRSGELVISPLLWTDMGEFSCHATNSYGSQSTSTFVYPTNVKRINKARQNTEKTGESRAKLKFRLYSQHQTYVIGETKASRLLWLGHVEGWKRIEPNTEKTGESRAKLKFRLYSQHQTYVIGETKASRLLWLGHVEGWKRIEPHLSLFEEERKKENKYIFSKISVKVDIILYISEGEYIAACLMLVATTLAEPPVDNRYLPPQQDFSETVHLQPMELRVQVPVAPPTNTYLPNNLQTSTDPPNLEPSNLPTSMDHLHPELSNLPTNMDPLRLDLNNFPTNMDHLRPEPNNLLTNTDLLYPNPELNNHLINTEPHPNSETNSQPINTYHPSQETNNLLINMDPLNLLTSMDPRNPLLSMEHRPNSEANPLANTVLLPRKGRHQISTEPRGKEVPLLRNMEPLGSGPRHKSMEHLVSELKQNTSLIGQQYSGDFGAGQSRQYLPPGAGRGYNGDEDGNGEPANYSFEYMVKDDASGNDFGHRESRMGDRAEGLYYVVLPDGRKQTVEYEADQDGYKPRISYEDTGAGAGYDQNSQNGGYNQNGRNNQNGGY